jgi:hypothetical protein
MIIFQQIRDIQNQRFDKTVLKSKKNIYDFFGENVLFSKKITLFAADLSISW